MHCGIKAKAGALDLAVLAVDTFASMAGLFTTNLAQAAPVLVSKRHLDVTHGAGCAIVVNSGCAERAAPAKTAWHDAADDRARSPRALGCQPEQVLVASTGVIGVALPIDRVVAGHRAGVLVAAPTARQRRGARDHDDRSVPEGARGRASTTPRGVVSRRRHGARAPA